jgi:MOSC domain-containing protein YiiM
MQAMPRTSAELTAEEARTLRDAPSNRGTVELIVARPQPGQRAVLDSCELSVTEGLVGDSWATRAPGEEMLDCQVTLMSARAATLIAGTKDDWPPAGDQFFVDMDLSVEHLPPGTRLTIGDAEVRISEEPHLGCGKFISRYGVNAQKLVNSPVGRELRLRGVNAQVMRAGSVRVGDAVCRVGPDA